MIDPRSVPVRFSRLKNIAQSLATYRHSLDADTETPALRLGRCTHLTLFKNAEFAVYDGDRRGKRWEEFRDAHLHVEVFTAKEANKAYAMAEAVRRDPMSRPYIEAPGTVEQVLRWTITGRECQGTPDKFNDDFTMDLKSTRCAKPEWFRADMRRLKHVEQVSWYGNGIELALRRPRPRESVIIAVESVAPHLVTVMRPTARKLEEAERTWRLWFEQLLVAESSDLFPGYVQHVVDVDVDEADEAPALTWGDEDESEAA